MKRLLAIKLTLVLLAVTATFEKAEAKDALEKGFTMKLAYVMPSATFGRMPVGPPDFLSLSYPLTKSNAGFGFQLGTMFYINAIDLGDQMKIGIDVTWLSLNYSTNNHDFTVRTNSGNINYTSFVSTKFYHAHFMMEVGPMFSYSPVEKLGLDASFKASPTVGLTGGSWSLADGDRQTFGGGGFGFRFTPAFYARYNVLLLGFEYNIGNVNMTYSSSSDAFGSASGSVPYTTARVVFGFKF